MRRTVASRFRRRPSNQVLAEDARGHVFQVPSYNKQIRVRRDSDAGGACRMESQTDESTKGGQLPLRIGGGFAAVAVLFFALSWLSSDDPHGGLLSLLVGIFLSTLSVFFTIIGLGERGVVPRWLATSGIVLSLAMLLYFLLSLS